MARTTSGTNLFHANRQWSTRPDDQRFVSLAELAAAVKRRKDESRTHELKTDQLRVLPQSNEDMLVQLPAVDRPVELNNWSFGQLARLADVPADYLRKLPAQLAAINLQFGLERRPSMPSTLAYRRENGSHTMMALTSPSYGRIYDAQVVDAVIAANQSGTWQVPAASYTTSNPRRATTLYASDRDVWLFLVDPEHVIEVDGDKLYRGFIAYNSEVGSRTFGLMTFLYRYVCDNRIIWGATQVKELKIRHTSGGPERFLSEAAPALKLYANESAAATEAAIRKAKDDLLPVKQDESVSDWLRSRGFTRPEADSAVKFAQAEEGDARTLWQIVNGVTAYARTIEHTDSRVELEQKAGKLMTLVS